MKYRCVNAPHLSLGYFINNKLIAFIHATQSDKSQFTQDGITHHTQDGQTVLLHCLWVLPDQRKKGIASKLLETFVTRVHDMVPQPKKICLVDEEKDIGFWHKLGFLLLGPTDVYDTCLKDGRTYYEMERTIVPSEKSCNTGAFTTRPLTEEDSMKSWILETNGYLSFEESASLDTVKCRLQHAPHMSMGHFRGDELIAWISAVRSDKPTLTNESMFKHVTDGETVCLHSVCVMKEHRKKGIARTLVKDYIEHIKQLTPRPSRICLVAHDYLVPFYTSVGFNLTGPSDFQWANGEWFGMEYTL